MLIKAMKVIETDTTAYSLREVQPIFVFRAIHLLYIVRINPQKIQFIANHFQSDMAPACVDV